MANNQVQTTANTLEENQAARVDKRVLLEKINIGLKQSKAGKVFSTPDAKLALQKWLK